MNEFKRILDKNKNLSKIIEEQEGIKRQTIYNYKVWNTRPDINRAIKIYEILLDLNLIKDTNKITIETLFD